MQTHDRKEFWFEAWVFYHLYYKKDSNYKTKLELDDSGKSNKLHIRGSRIETKQFKIKVQLDSFSLVTRRIMFFEQF